MYSEKIERYLINLSLSYELINDGMWIIHDPDRGLENVVVYADDSIVAVRVKVMDLPNNDAAGLYEQLLRLNLEMLHGAYALEDNHIVLLNTFVAESMDLEEFQATLDSLGMALAQHYPVLNQFRG